MNEITLSVPEQTAPCLICRICGRRFVFASFDREYARSVPEACPICRHAMAEEKRREREAEENRKWLAKKREDQEKFERLLKNYRVVPMEDIRPERERTLYILGNGFDLMHGVKSSYYNFRDSMGKGNNLRQMLETFWVPEDIWADFENALAKFNLRAMSGNYVVDSHLDIAGAYDEDAGAAEYYQAVEMAANPIATVANELPKTFRRWVEGLTVGTDDRPLQSLFGDGRVLCFNYTEFVETLYGMASDRVCYVHGCRKNKKDELILGHLSGASDEMYDFDDRGMPTRDRARRHLIGLAQDDIYRIVARSDESLTKHCDEIIAAHRTFFSELHDIRDVVVVGHSMSRVDLDYFKEVWRSISDQDSVRWYIGCHGLRDLESMESLLGELGLARDRVTVFRTDLISATFYPSAGKDQAVPKDKAEKRCGMSSHGKWRAMTEKNILKIYGTSSKDALFEIVFSWEVSRAVFSEDGDIMLAVIRGLDSGIFLFRHEDSAWRFVNELQGIPHQSLLNPRLRHVYLTEQTVTFVYNSRVRKYSLSDGTLTENRARRYLNGYTYEGVDIKESLLQRGVRSGRKRDRKA